MPEPTNLDAITTWCHTCGRPVSMPHEHGDAPPTPTVIESDRKIAEEWYRCGCGMTYETIMESGRPDGDHHHVADEVERMASEIAAAREAWGVPREAVVALVEATRKRGHDDRCNADLTRDPCYCGFQAVSEAIAALERAKGDGA